MSKPTFLSLEDILAVPEDHSEVVDVPEWGGSVTVRPLTKAMQINVRKRAVRNGNIDERLLEGLILVNGIVHPKGHAREGEPMFEATHIDRLFAKDANVVDRLLTRIMNMSGMSDGAVEEAEEDMKS